MKGDAIKLVRLMKGSDKRFVIPVYQRSYNWQKQHCAQLFNDLVKMVKSGRTSHFFGCIVSVYDDNSSANIEEFLIIDGQQRLTTIFLLLLAMHKLLVSGAVVSCAPERAERILKDFLVDEYQPKDARLKLKAIKDDQKAFRLLFGDAEQYIRESNLTLNYNYFCERILKKEISIDELYDALYRLEIINIRLSAPEDDPQLIFESLNSTGLALSEGDKIRNFVLMGQDVSTQERFYEEYWNPIEECTNYDVSAFVRDFLSVKQGVTPVISRTYFAFKEYVQTKEADADMERLLKELLTYARYYEKLLKGGTGNRTLDACIFRLNWLETTVCRPFLLEVLHQHHAENSLTLEEVADIFSIVENFVFRRAVCDVPTNALNKIFLTLNKEVSRLDDGIASYAERMKYALSVRRESGRFPDDAEFGSTFVTRQVYKMKSAARTYVLERIENYGTVETKDVWKLIDSKTYSIEHIMPQTLTAEWKSHLGPDFASIHEEWCHRIANLTLTAYNSDYSNRSFTAKRDHAFGFKNSGLRMNQRIKEKERWGLDEFKERSEELRELALKVWPAPKTDFRPIEKQFDYCPLDEEVSYTGRQIVRFNWKGTDYSVNSWADMYQQIMQELHNEDPSVLERIMASSDDELSAQLFTAKEGKLNKAEIAPGIWLLTHMETNKKIEFLRRFFERFDADPSDLVFYLREEGSLTFDEPARYEIRRRYWNFALEHIHAAHADGGTFQNVGETSRTWLDGFLGHTGFVLGCVANQDEARVVLYLGKVDKSLNKKVFDALYSRRSAIEAVIGRTLQWERRDDGKSSKIWLSFGGGVDICDETHWPRMAEFHAKWSRKFYDVFKPRLDEIMSTL